ncbi:hypothetical protein LXL04_019912 [Taraxacum kok-saghyz]
MTHDQLCAIIFAPTDDTFGPTDHLTGYNPAIFWHQITRLREYVPKYSKSSSIILPILRVAHCILASIMLPRHETSTVSSAELQLLWCMTHTFDTKSNFGAYLARRLSTSTPTTKGNICVGGLVTLITSVEHEHLPPPPVDYAQYHQTYQEHFSSLDRQLADIRDDVDCIATGLVEQTSIFEDFRTEQRERWRLSRLGLSVGTPQVCSLLVPCQRQFQDVNMPFGTSKVSVVLVGTPQISVFHYKSPQHDSCQAVPMLDTGRVQHRARRSTRVVSFDTGRVPLKTAKNQFFQVRKLGVIGHFSGQTSWEIFWGRFGEKAFTMIIGNHMGNINYYVLYYI